MDETQSHTNGKESFDVSKQPNSNHTTVGQEDIRAKILAKYKSFQQETGCTDEELLDLVMDIEINTIDDLEELPTNCDDILKMFNYGSHDFWDKRYIESEEPFEWYFKWSYIEPKLSPYYKGKDLALILGCGNSEMSFEIQKNDVKKVVSIDISKTVIQQMSEKYKDNENLFWFEMDCTDMGFKDDLFDAVLDKGTFDAILCGNNRISNVLTSMSEIWRVLKNNGFFIEISHTGPNERMKIFKSSDENWKYFDPIVIKYNESGDLKKRFTYIYVFQKIVKDDEK